MTWGDMEGETKYKPLAIKGARLKIGEQEAEESAETDAKEVKFTMTLQAGDTELQSWFENDTEKDFGAFYVYVKRL